MLGVHENNSLVAKFNNFMDGCMREMKAKLGKIGAGLKLNGVGWSVTDVCLWMTLCCWQRVRGNFREW